MDKTLFLLQKNLPSSSSPRFDILIDGYNSLDRNSVRYYLLFRARDTNVNCLEPQR